MTPRSRCIADRPRAASHLYYGWRIVAVAFLVDFVAVGFFFYSYGVFFKAIARDLGGSRFGVSLGLALANLVGAIAAPFVGRALDRFPIRRIMLAGACSTALGFALASQVHHLAHFYLVLATLVALGTSSMGGISSATLVSNWFVARRGTAFGVATMGISLSGLVMPTVATALIQHLGWRGGLLVYAAGTLLIVVPPVARVVVSRPEAIGILPDGGRTPQATATALAGERTWRTREILRSERFWVVALPFALAFFSISAVLTHMVPHATDIGIDPYRAASVLSAAAGAGVAGKFVFGWLVDRLDARIAVGLSLATQLAGLAAVAIATGYPPLFAGALVFGFGMGGNVPLQSTLTGRAFGRLSYGKVAGLMRPVQVPIHALGVPLAGWIFDLTGSYRIAFWIFGAAYLVAMALVARLRLPAPRRGPEPPAPGGAAP